MEILARALKQVLFVLDQVTYGLIPSAYELIFYLSNVDLFNNDIILGVINRVYLLLGIFMLFKVAFSMIRFLIDPNAFSDQSKGFGKLVTNSLVALVLLVMTPFLFEKAYEFQSDILLSNVIPRLILGDTSYKDYTETKVNSDNIRMQQSDIHSMGVDVQFAMFSAFYNLNTSNDQDGFTACRPDEKHPISNVLGSSDMIETCWDKVKDPLTTELHGQGGTLRELFKYQADKNYSGEKCPDGICDERNFAGFSKLLWWTKAGGNSPATINYTPIISALVGGYLLLLLITFAIDIAVRVFKLLFLQTIAPIAIISYMDPSESVSKGKFHNWLSECGKTYVSLFLRLAVIYLAILLVRIITSSVFHALDDSSSLYYNGVAPTDTMNMFVYVFLILGVFTFAKKVPQMIEGIFGVKMSGDMNLNPFKAIKETPVLGNALSSAAGWLIGGAAGTWAGFRAGSEAGAPLRGALVGGVRGTSGGVNEGLKQGMFGKVRGRTYKEMTGNDLRTFNPAQTLLKPGSKSNISEVSAPLKQAKTQKSAYEERLIKTQTANRTADKLLSKYGIKAGSFVKTDGTTDTKAIADAKSAFQKRQVQSENDLSKARNTRNQLIQKKSDYESQINRLNNQISSAKVSMEQTDDDKIKKQLNNQIISWESDLRVAQTENINVNKNIAKVETDTANLEGRVKDYGEIVNALTNYEQNRQEEIDIQNEIKSIDSNIKTLDEEKKQREQFYGVERSSKQNVGKAIDEISKRDKKEDSVWII